MSRGGVEEQFSSELIKRPSSRGVILGLPWISLVVGAVTLVCGVVILKMFGMNALLVSLPFLICVVVLGLVPFEDRKLIEWVGVFLDYVARRVTRQDRYRARLLEPRPDGTLGLPGNHASLRLWEDAPSGAVFIHDPHMRTLVAVARVKNQGFLLLDSEEKDRRSFLFATMIGQIAAGKGIDRVQFISRFIPDAGLSVKAWWDSVKSGALNEGARANYESMMSEVTQTSERHEQLIVIRLNLASSARSIRALGGGMAGAGALMRQRMRLVENAARQCEIEISEWLTRPELARHIRSAYSPALSVFLEQHDNVGRSASTAGPMATRESWGMYRTDDTFHCTLRIEWPGIPVWPDFMHPIAVNPNLRSSFSLVFEPIGRHKAIKDAKKAVNDEVIHENEQNKYGQTRTVLDENDALEASQDLHDIASGFRDVRFVGLITVSAADEDSLQEALETARSAAAEASGCELHVCYGQQAGLFPVAALPLADGIAPQMMNF